MRRFIFSTLILFSLCSFQTEARSHKKDPRLSEYVLTYKQFERLSLRKKVNYFKFLVTYLGKIEDMQVAPKSKKTAMLMQQFYEMTVAAAHAEGYKVEGATCIHSFAISEYVQSTKSPGKLVCAPPQVSSKCGAGKTGCGDQLFALVKNIPGKENLAGLCVPTDYRLRTINCWKAVEHLAGPDLDQAVASQVEGIARDPALQKQFDAFAAKAKATLEEFQDQRTASGMSIREYCALDSAERGKNKANNGLQDQECGIIVEAIDKFSAAKSNLQIQPAAADGEQGEPAIGEDAAAVDEAAPQAPAPPADLPDDEAARPAFLPEPNAPVEASAEAPSKPTARANETALGPLACVAEGLGKALSSQSAAYTNWVALVGVMVQKQDPTRITDDVSRQVFQTKVIEAIGTLGYCSNKTYDVNLGADPKVRNWLDGSKAPTDKAIAKSFSIDASFAKDMTSDIDSNGGSLIERRNSFTQKAASYGGSNKFANCAGKLSTLDVPRMNLKCNATLGIYNTKANTDFRNAIAKQCGAPKFKSPKPEKCSGDEVAQEPAPVDESVVEDETFFEEPPPPTKGKKTLTLPEVPSKAHKVKRNWGPTLRDCWGKNRLKCHYYERPDVSICRCPDRDSKERGKPGGGNPGNPGKPGEPVGPRGGKGGEGAETIR